MIQLNNISKYYIVNNIKRYIFKDVSLTIPSSTNVGIIGRNGSGKSTLLRILGGIDHPSSGSVHADVSFSWPLGVSGGQGSLTGRENARFISRIYSRSLADERRVIDFILEFTELGDYFDQPIKNYSSGMRARLNFGMSLAFDFDYYLIDETLAVGDPVFQQKAKSALRNLTHKRNFLLVNHGLTLLQNMCDAGIVIINGKVSYFPDIKDAISSYTDYLNTGLSA